MICHEIYDFPPCPVPGCPHPVAEAKDVLHIMDQVLPPACWVLAEIVICSVLLEESCSVTVDTVGEGEKMISLSNLGLFLLRVFRMEKEEMQTLGSHSNCLASSSRYCMQMHW